MKNLTVRSLNIDDEEIYEEFIFEHIAFEQEYLTDNSIKTNKKYISYPNFKEWYKNNGKNIYLVFTNKKLIGAFEVYNCEDSYGTITLDIRPTEREKGYEKIIINFIRNLCSLEDIEHISLISSVPYLFLNKENTSEEVSVYNYDINKVLIKKY